MVAGTILIIDDDNSSRSLLKRIISIEGFKVIDCQDYKSAKQVLLKEEVNLIICDVRLPDANGVDLIKQLKTNFPQTEIVLLTAFGNIGDSVAAMKNGAFDYLIKGDDNARILPLINQIIEKTKLTSKLNRLEKTIHRVGFNSIIGESSAIKDTISLAKKVAPTDAAVLLLGETGTGKELFAKAIHNNSNRSDQAFIAFNCSAFPKELIESELFGYKAGSFTGALKNKKGLLEEADEGTIFLDEIGEMHIELQAKILRVLETGEFIKIGDTKTTTVDVRFISATNRDLYKEVANGRFREDLLYRLNIFTLKIPPLRERKNDILILAENFVHYFSKKMNKHVKGISVEVEECLKKYNWKGNVRELRNVIERAVLMSNSEELTLSDIPFELTAPAVDIKNNHKSISVFELQNIESQHIKRVLDYTKGNKAEAARLLNIGIATLYRKIEIYGIKTSYEMN